MKETDILYSSSFFAGLYNAKTLVTIETLANATKEFYSEAVSFSASGGLYVFRVDGISVFSVDNQGVIRIVAKPHRLKKILSQIV